MGSVGSAMRHQCNFFWLSLLNVLLAIPALMIILGVGTGYFIVQLILLGYGIVFALVEACCGWCIVIRWAANLFMGIYILFQLSNACYAGYMAYLFISPMNTIKNAGENCAGFDYIGAVVPTPSCGPKSAMMYWYGVGASFSILSMIICLGLIAESVALMKVYALKNNSKDKPSGDGKEAEPLMGKPATNTENGVKLA